MEQALTVALDRRARVLLAAALVLVVAVAFLVLGRQRDPVPDAVSPLVGADTAFAAAPDVTTTIEMPVALLCAPDGERVVLTGLEPVGGNGEVTVLDYSPKAVTADCTTGKQLTLVADLLRRSGEAASVDGFIVSYRVDDTEDSRLVDRPATLCRQLSECSF